MNPAEMTVGKFYWIPAKRGRIRIELTGEVEVMSNFCYFRARRVRTSRRADQRAKGWTTWENAKLHFVSKTDYGKIEETTI